MTIAWSLAALLGAMAPQDAFEKARDRLMAGVNDSNVPDVRASLEGVRAEQGAKAARALIAALAKAADRLRLVDRALEEGYKTLDKAKRMSRFTEADRRARDQAIDDAEDRIEGVLRLLRGAEEIHELIRGQFRFLRSDEAVAAISDEMTRTGAWATKCEMSDALGGMEPDSAEAALAARLEAERDEPVTTAILGGLGQRLLLETPTIRAVASRLLHASWGVRCAAARALATTGSRQAVGALVEALQKEEGRVRFEIDGALKELTKTDCGGDAAAWREWWTLNKADFEAGTYDPKNPQRPPGPGRTTFFQVPVESRRVCFVIDRSGSMRDGMPSRWETVRDELERLIAALPDGARVNVVLFDEKVDAFCQATRALDAMTRRDLKSFLGKQSPSGGTNLYDALEKALSLVGSVDSGRVRDDGVDTIYVLSDGEPSTGKISDADLLVKIFSRWNRWLRGTVHAVSAGEEVKVLRRLAESNGGQAVVAGKP